MAVGDITPGLLINSAAGGFKLKGSDQFAQKAEKDLIDYMVRNKCTIVLDKDGNLVFKDKPRK